MEVYANYKRFSRYSVGLFSGLIEVWKDVIGYEGLYQVSSFGNIKSLARDAVAHNGKRRPMQERFLKLKMAKTGYINVTLSKDSKRTTHLVHRIVASAFLENQESKPTVNHKDGNGCNNNVGNLEWATYKEQHKHALDNNLIERRGKQKYSTEFKKQVYDYYLQTNCSIPKLASAFNLPQKTAFNIAKGGVKVRPTTRILKSGETIIEEMLSKEAVAEIKKLRSLGWTYRELAEKFNRGISQMFRVCKGQSRNNEIE